jgi:TonB family protein
VNTSDFVMQAAWRGTLLMAASFGAMALLPKASAAVRHYVWATVFCALLALPAAMTLGPKWTLPAAATPAATVLTVHPLSASETAPSSTRSQSNPLSWIYWAGVAVVAFRFAAGAIRTRRMLTGAIGVDHAGVVPHPIRVVESERAPVPLVWGAFRPVIALPAASRQWSADRLRTVLLHELIHVERRDLLAQRIGQAACCFYWFHPLVWIAAREMRKERERACDDAVLQRGIAPAEYAGHLVELVRGLTIAAPAMAEANDFEGRVRALLDRGRNRRPLTRRIALTVAAIACALILPVGSITSYAQADRGALAGIVADPSGARVPGAEVVAKNLDGANQETTVADAAGEYGFPAIPAGRYELQFKMRGFKLARKELAVTAGAASRADINLEIGEGFESVKVVGNQKAPAPTVTASAPRRIPVGGNVQPFKLLAQPRPQYPPELQQQGITGTVVIRAIIGKTGEVLQPQVINTTAHPGLVQAALDAVRQWRYDPARLNGEPVETLTTVTINFELGQ